jgi:CheY-like chemotaxis protein
MTNSGSALDLQTRPASSGPIDLSRALILIVDDNLQNVELMQAYLESLPCRVKTATDGLEAIQLIDEETPDLVLLDIMMPRMSGFEVCQKIKTSPATRDTIVIMVTALHEVGDYERAVECGTNDFISKPVNKLELLTRVRSLLELSLLKRRFQELQPESPRPTHIRTDPTRPQAGSKLEQF